MLVAKISRIETKMIATNPHKLVGRGRLELPTNGLKVLGAQRIADSDPLNFTRASLARPACQALRWSKTPA